MEKIKILLLVVSVALCKFVSGQNFEGEIIYSNTFKSKLPNFTDEQLQLLIGDKQEYFIKDGYYKSLSNGQALTVQLYDNKTNRIYNKTPKADTLYWFDASVNTDTVASFEIKKNAGKILGYECDAIIMKTKTGTTTIYYNTKYKVDNKLYTKHNYSNWAFYVNQTKALPLKTVVETNQFKMESTAVEIKPMNFETGFFDIDPKAPVKKS